MSIIERALDKTRKHGVPAEGSAIPATETSSPRSRHASLSRPALALPASLKGKVDLGAPVLNRFGLLPEQEVAGAISHQFRRIKRPLVARALSEQQQPGRVVLNRIVAIASAGPGDGKTFTSVHLALSLALERDLSTVLIDADIAKSELTSVFGLQDQRGFLDLVEHGNLQLEECLYSSSVPGLYVLPSGTWRDHAPELLATAAVESRLAEILARVPDSLLVLDTPPVLLTNESQLLLTHAGQILFVVNADVTSRANVADALAAINRPSDIQLVFNRFERANSMSYSYGYYGTDASVSGRSPRSGAP